MNAPGDPRAELRARFLAEAGWSRATARPLAGDASNRRYERLTDGPGGAGAVLMDAPPERGEDPGPFLAVTKRLRRAGFSAPEVYFADRTAGFLLLEDLGDALFARVCASDSAQERPLYAAAGAVLAEIQARSAAENGFEPPPYDAKTLLKEAVLAVDWWWKGVSEAPSEGQEQAFEALVTAACAPVSEARGALVLRDYHAENLVWLPERRGSARVGLLDYQDALAGHGAYDLISLTEDARRALLANGYANLSVREIAKRVGISIGNLQYYYPSKDDLVEAIIQQEIDHSLGLLDEIEWAPKHIKASLGDAVSTVLNYLAGPAGRLYLISGTLALTEARFQVQHELGYAQVFASITQILRVAAPHLDPSIQGRYVSIFVALIDGATLRIQGMDDAKRKSETKKLAEDISATILALIKTD